MKGPQSVIQSQVEQTSSKEVILEPLAESVYDHPINSQIGLEAVSIVEDVVGRSEEISVLWKFNPSDGVQSSKGCLQIFGNKS